MRHLFQKFANIFWGALSHKLHTSIDDISIYDWHHFQKGELGRLIVKRRAFFPRDVKQRVAELMEDFYSRFGKTKDMLNHLKKIQELTALMCQHALEKDALAGLQIKQLEAELKLEENNNVDIHKMVTIMSAFQGYNINPHKIKVPEFYSIIERMKERAEKIKSN